MKTTVIISALIFLTSFLLAVLRVKYKREKFFTPFRIIFIGTFLSSVILLFPVYYDYFSEDRYSVLLSLLSTLQHTFRLFALDGEFVSCIDMIRALIVNNKTVLDFAIIVATLLYFTAPVLTFTFLLSLFKNIIARIRYKSIFWWKKVHIFSELNDRSLALAKSIIKEEEDKNSKIAKLPKVFRNNVIIFTDVSSEDEATTAELVEDARELGAILFYKDIEAFTIAGRYNKKKINIYLISEDENSKISQANHIMKNYDFPGIELYVFSESTQSQMILRDKKVKNLRVVRVNDIRTLIYHNLDTFGMRLFDKAYTYNKNGENGSCTISAVIIGFGRYGKEMLKALTWFCQYPKFNLVIDVFDSDGNAEDYYKFHFPGIAERSGNFFSGEDNYTIRFHSGININSPKFNDEFNAIESPTYVFVCLGTDEDNINAAINVRSLCKKRGLSNECVDIETVVYNSNSAELMSCTWEPDKTPSPMYETAEKAKEAMKAKANPYDKSADAPTEPASKDDNTKYGIHIIGDLDSFYSYSTVIDPKWEEEGKMANRRYFLQKARAEKIQAEREAKARAASGEEAFPSLTENEKLTPEELKRKRAAHDAEADVQFWQFEYYYRSSVSKAIHEKLKLKLHQFTDYGAILEGLKNPPKAIADWSYDEIMEYSELEHPRWCAYMKSEGYVKGAAKDTVAKTHPNLDMETVTDLVRLYDL